MKRDDFEKFRGDVFVLRADAGNEIDIKLVEVSEARETKSHEEFSIVFLAPPGSVLEPLSYKLAHKDIGEIELFLSPFRSDESGLKLEAAFCLTTN
jgi:hypothetical protein